jgi:hypothetical protein
MPGVNKMVLCQDIRHVDLELCYDICGVSRCTWSNISFSLISVINFYYIINKLIILIPTQTKSLFGKASLQTDSTKKQEKALFGFTYVVQKQILPYGAPLLKLFSKKMFSSASQKN